MDLKKASDRGSINNSKLEAADQSAASQNTSKMLQNALPISKVPVSPMAGCPLIGENLSMRISPKRNKSTNDILARVSKPPVVAE